MCYLQAGKLTHKTDLVVSDQLLLYVACPLLETPGFSEVLHVDIPGVIMLNRHMCHHMSKHHEFQSRLPVVLEGDGRLDSPDTRYILPSTYGLGDHKVVSLHQRSC